MLAQVILSGTGGRAKLGFTPQAGKTGTAQSYRDAWFIGYTGHSSPASGSATTTTRKRRR